MKILLLLLLLAFLPVSQNYSYKGNLVRVPFDPAQIDPADNLGKLV